MEYQRFVLAQNVLFLQGLCLRSGCPLGRHSQRIWQPESQQQQAHRSIPPSASGNASTVADPMLGLGLCGGVPNGAGIFSANGQRIRGTMPAGSCPNQHCRPACFLQCHMYGAEHIVSSREDIGLESSDSMAARLRKGIRTTSCCIHPLSSGCRL